MDKAKRADMLRSAFRANGGIPLAFASVRKQRLIQPTAKGSRLNEWPQIEVNHKRAPQWVRDSEAKPALTISLKRRPNESPLIRMSRKLCLKLPKVLP